VVLTVHIIIKHKILICEKQGKFRREGDKLHSNTKNAWKDLMRYTWEAWLGEVEGGEIACRVPMRLLVEKSVNSKKSGSGFPDFC